MKKITYFIPKNELPGSCHYEFQPGKYKIGLLRVGKMKLDTSIYLYEYDDYSAMAPLAYLIKDFSMCGVTYINESDGEILIEKLRQFACLLEKGKKILEALEIMGVYNPAIDGSRREEDGIANLDLEILKNTAEELADWSEKILKENKMISIIGI